MIPLRKAGWLLSVLAVLALSPSCKKSEPAPDPVIPITSFSAYVDGKIFYGGTVLCDVTGGSLTVEGVANHGLSKEARISLLLKDFTGVGSYPVDSATRAGYSTISSSSNASTGTIVITANNSEHTAGTFSFETPSNQITNGKFDVYR